MFTFIGLGGQELLFLLIPVVLFLVVPILALVDVVRSNFQGQNDKLIWVIIVVFVPVIGSILYFLIGRNQRTV